MENGTVTTVAADVIGASDHTLIYPDDRLLTRLLTTYPDLHERTNAVVIPAHELKEWLNATLTIMYERGVDPPPDR